MDLIRHSLRLTRHVLVLGTAAAGIAGTAEAQVGLGSGLAQVTLVARVAPRGTIGSVADPVKQSRRGSVHELSVQVTVSANAPYHLVVRQSDAVVDRVSRIWVRRNDGEFQRLERDSRIVVARATRASGEARREVHYRIETADTLATPVRVVPVRYEMLIDPSL